MSFGFDPEYAWQVWAATAVVLVTACGLAALWWAGHRVGHLGGSTRTRVLVASLTGAAAVFLSIALSGPAIFRQGGFAEFHVVVLVDVSDSMLRAEGGWTAVRRGASERLRDAFRNRPERITAQLLTFRSEVVAVGPVRPLRRIADQVAQLSESSFAVGPGTNIANGLIRGGEAIDRAGGRGAVVLVSDGNETDGDGRAAAAQLAARGIAVHVLPIAGGPPTLGILSANLPPNVDAGSETFARGVLTNAADVKVDASLELVQHALPEAQAHVDPLRTRKSVPFAGRQLMQFRTPLVFTKPGLQFVDVAIAGSGGTPERRRLFTHVERPPRVIAFGNDRWTSAFPDGAIQIVRREPGDIKAHEPIDDFDAVVIDGVPGGSFGRGVLEEIARAIESKHTGLFVMNGRHLGSARAATNLMSYDDTPLEALLPLLSQARAKRVGPPPRHIVMLVDTSGSMCGSALSKAQEIAAYVVEHFLRSEDLLDLMAFTTSASSLVTGEAMTPEGKTHATDEIRRMTCNGGTNPTDALRRLAARKLKNCGLLFFSDGGFGQLQQLSEYRPDCRTTVFGIRPEPFGPNEPMAALADPINVDANFDPSRIKIPYFDPMAKDQFYEPGAYTPLSMKFVLPRGQVLDVPALPLDGSATTTAKDDVVPVAVRPKLTDPVLAYREAGTGNVGELTTDVPAGWLSHEEGRAAVRQWIEATFPLVDSRRYVIRLTERADELEMEIALTPAGGRLPNVEQIAASLDMPGAPLAVTIRRDEGAPATFRGRVRIPASDRPATATLVLQESGPHALPRPQRIAMVVPTRQELSGPRLPESSSFGLNDELLRSIADQGNGTYDALERMAEDRAMDGGRKIEIWPMVAALGCACYLAAILLRRVDP